MAAPKAESEKAPGEPQSLKDAVRDARIEAAERSGVVVDLRDAEVARLELLNEALEPLFAEIPKGVDLFDRGISRGDVPRLWIDVIAHIEMGRDKRQYRFVQDTRYGRSLLGESYDTAEMVAAVRRYIARRLVERERALSADADGGLVVAQRAAQLEKRSRRWRAFRNFVLGVIVGVVALFALATFYTP